MFHSQERRGAQQATLRGDHRPGRSSPQHPERSASQEVRERSGRKGEISVAGVLKKRFVQNPGSKKLTNSKSRLSTTMVVVIRKLLRLKLYKTCE